MPLRVSDIKPLKFEKLYNDLLSTFNISTKDNKDISYASIKNPNTEKLQKVFIKILSSDIITGSKIFRHPISGESKEYHHGMVRLMVCNVLRAFGYKDYNECFPVQLFIFPSWEFLKKIFMAFLKIGKYFIFNMPKVGQFEEETRNAMKNQEILYKKCQSKEQDLQKAKIAQTEEKAEYQNAAKAINSLQQKKAALTEDCSDLDQSLLKLEDNIQTNKAKQQPVYDLINDKQASLQCKLDELDDGGVYAARLYECRASIKELKSLNITDRSKCDSKIRDLNNIRKILEILKSTASLLNTHETTIRSKNDKLTEISKLEEKIDQNEVEDFKLAENGVKLTEDVLHLRKQLQLTKDDESLLENERRAIQNAEKLAEKIVAIEKEKVIFMNKISENGELLKKCQDLLASARDREEFKKMGKYLVEFIDEKIYKEILPNLMQTLSVVNAHPDFGGTGHAYLDGNDVEEYFSDKMEELGLEFDSSLIDMV